MKYKVFATEAEALAAEKAISQAMGYSKAGVNAATGDYLNASIARIIYYPVRIPNAILQAITI